MKGSRLTAAGLVAAAGLWILSGHLFPHEDVSRAATKPTEAAAQKPFRVAVEETQLVPHSRKLVLSGRTEADRKVTLIARTGGVLTELRVKRGSRVKKDDVIAVLSDDAREAQVAQAHALMTQRRAELDAKRRLIETGAMPKLDLVNLESQLKAAEAGLAAAEAERDRGVVRAPWDGIITDTVAEVGGAAFSFQGREIATLVALDPMLAVVEVAERKLAGLQVGNEAGIRLVTGQTATGKIRFVSKSASASTRTYRVEVELKNPDGAIPDGITAEVSLPLVSSPATRVPRSALTLSSAGDIGVRIVGADGNVAFLPVSVVEDEQKFIWLAGIENGARVIVQGQDFVREGQAVQAVPVAASTAQK
ncbi:MAG: efflux RND transporter periplasmic adaptor subunit [Pseudorhodoplanes sp.]